MPRRRTDTRGLLRRRRPFADADVEGVPMDLVAVHRRYGAVGGTLGRDIDKAVAQPFSVCRIAGDRRSQHHPKGVEGFSQFIVGELRRQVRNKNVTAETTRSHPPSPSVVGSDSHWGTCRATSPAEMFTSALLRCSIGALHNHPREISSLLSLVRGSVLAWETQFARLSFCSSATQR